MADTHSKARRLFLARTLQSLGTLELAALAKGAEATAATDALASPQPNLVNIHARGGWDTFWFHSAFRSSELSDYLAAHPDAPKGLFTARHPDAFLTSHQGHWLGLGTSEIFTPEDLGDILIWKGLLPAGGHDDGNRILNCGQSSPYAASFCSVVAEHTARTQGTLPLHYLQVSATPEQLFSPPGLMKGSAIPVNVPDLESFVRLTRGTGMGFADRSRRDLIDATLRKIAESVSPSQLKLRKSRLVMETFMSSLQGLSKIYGTNHATSPEFTSTLERYTQAARAATTTLVEKLASVGGVAPGYPDFIPNARYWLPRIDYAAAAFPYALAEFLLKYRLSRVINFKTPISDYHKNNEQDLISVAITMTLYRELIRGLKRIPAPGGDGKSLFDMTTLVLSTEFDRTFGIFPNDPTLATVPGTNHGSFLSILMAGYRVRNGAVIGDYKVTPAGFKTAKYGSAFQELVMGSPLPIDPATGRPSPSGVVYSSQSIFPTILSMFGTPIPSQQITEHPVVRAVIREG